MSLLINEALVNIGSTNLVLTAGLVGFLAYPVVVRICRVAKAVFALASEWVAKRTFIVHLHSLFCDECAQNHKRHMYETPTPPRSPKLESK